MLGEKTLSEGAVGKVCFENLDVFCEFVDALATTLYPRGAEGVGGVDEGVVLLGPGIVETVAALELLIEEEFRRTLAAVDDALFEESFLLGVGFVQLVDECGVLLIVYHEDVFATQAVGADQDGAVTLGKCLCMIVRAVTALAACRHRHGDGKWREEVFTIHRRRRC